MKELQSKARQSLKGETQHSIYKTRFYFISQFTEHGIISATKKLLDEKYGKLIQVKLFNGKAKEKQK